jgi:hypothetical protein
MNNPYSKPRLDESWQAVIHSPEGCGKREELNRRQLRKQREKLPQLRFLCYLL